MERKQKIDLIQGILAGILLLLTGVQNWQTYPLISGITIGCGILLFVYAGFFRFRSADSRFKLAVISMEGVAFLLTAYIYFAEGRQYLQYAMLLAAAGCFVAVIVTFRKWRNHWLRE